MNDTKKLTRKFTAKFDLDTFDKLENLATQAQKNKSEILRLLVAEGTVIQTKKTKTIDPNFLYELNKIGNNINQITKHVNTKKEIDLMAFFELDSINKKLDYLLDLLANPNKKISKKSKPKE